MTIIEIFDTFAFYGLDITVLATLTVLFVQLLKKSILRKVQKKVMTFLPFFVGALLYTLYMSVKTQDVCYFLHNYTTVLEQAIAIGSLATLTYILYEQFVRKEQSTSAVESVIATMIAGYVPTNSVNGVAKHIAETLSKDVLGTGASKTEQILLDNKEACVTEKDIQLLSKLIIQTLAHISI